MASKSSCACSHDPEAPALDNTQAHSPVTSPQFHPTTLTYLAFSALCVIVLTEALDAMSISIALPSISASVHATTTQTFSLGTSFLLSSLIFQPILTSLSYIFGRKPALLASLSLFLAGAAIAGAARHIGILLGGRIIQGIGAAGVVALTAVVLADLVPLRERGKWIAGLNAMWVVGSVTGPLIGGALAERDWRWIFWLNVPLVVIGMVSTTFFIHSGMPKGSAVSKILSVDFIGIGLFLLSATSFFLPFTWGGVVFAWSDWRTILPLALGTGGLILFFVYEERVAKIPMIPLSSLFSNRTARIGYAGSIVHGFLILMLVYYLPFYYMGVRQYSPQITAVAGLPETLTIAPAAIVTGIVISRSGRYKELLLVGWFLTTLGMGLICVMDVRTSVPAMVFINIIPGIGLGIVIPAQSLAIQAATPAGIVGHAVSMSYVVRTAGQAFGVAVGAAVFQNRLGTILQDYSTTGGLGVQDVTQLINRFHGNPEEKQALQMAILMALRAVWGTGCALAGLAGIASAWTQSLSLNQEVQMEHKVEEGERPRTVKARFEKET